MIKLNESENGMIKKIGTLLKKLSLIMNLENQSKNNKAPDIKNKIAPHRTKLEQDIFDNDGI
ncbi:MAG: hypothetical protein IPJ79_04920 [Bacteroidetes bacterium]|nr:hypothetical protein [Bacteroidota bacterium]HNR18647.1 hypothetical protein [Bacteroidia bacterium]HNU33427.1 hypothetical protein [Bacteroidia bacterium]